MLVLENANYCIMRSCVLQSVSAIDSGTSGLSLDANEDSLRVWRVSLVKICGRGRVLLSVHSAST